MKVVVIVIRCILTTGLLVGVYMETGIFTASSLGLSVIALELHIYFIKDLYKQQLRSKPHD